jgi:3-oxoacyl-[acyl-carrier protein] reductase
MNTGRVEGGRDRRKPLQLQGKTAIVTGAAQGIGEAIARKFASEGAAVAIADINLDKAREVAADICKGGGKAAAHKVDVSNRAEFNSMVKKVVESLGSVDILVNNAGIGRRQPLEEMTEEYWDAVLDVDLKSVLYGTQAVLPYMKKQHSGRIINISSVVGIDLFLVGSANYAAAKAGVIQLTRFTAMEAGRYGIYANAIAPGVIATEISTSRRTREEAEKYFEEAEERCSLGRVGTVEDVANVALFLASEACSYVTGQVIRVDGGRQDRSMDRALP